MKPIAVLYSTRQGHTRLVVEHIAGILRASGLTAEIQDVHLNEASIRLTDYSGVILAASIHFGSHEHEMVEFVKLHRAEIESMPSAFLSLSLAEAAAERASASPREHARFVADVEKLIADFFEQTGWHPHKVKPVAGALLYSKYNFLLRLVMRQIAKASGGDTDTTHDYVYTDWSALDRFVQEFAAETSAASRHDARLAPWSDAARSGHDKSIPAEHC